MRLRLVSIRDCAKNSEHNGGPNVPELVIQSLEDTENHASRNLMSEWVEFVVCREMMILDKGGSNVGQYVMQSLMGTENNASRKWRSKEVETGACRERMSLRLVLIRNCEKNSVDQGGPNFREFVL